MALFLAAIVAPITASVPALAIEEENEGHVGSEWVAGLSPDDYLRALKTTGMAAALLSANRVSADSWVSIGPTGDPSVSDLASPFGENNGRIRSIEIRSEAGTYAVYVGATSGGLWRAYGSAGPVWTSLGDNLPNPSVGAFAVHPSNAGDILVGTGDAHRYPGAGLFRTTDGGGTWQAVDLDTIPIPAASYRILYMPGNPGIVLAATSIGLLRSTLGGADGSWNLELAGNITDLVIDPGNPSRMYCCRATSPCGVYRSTDGGDVWTPVGSATIPTIGIINARIALCRNSPNILVMVHADTTNTIQGIWRSTNSGDTWAALSGTPPIGGEEAFHALAVAIRPDTPAEIWVGANQIWRTTNTGGSWTDLTSIATHQDQTQIYFSSLTGDDVAWICNDGGIHRYMIGAGGATTWNGNATTGLRVSTFDYIDAVRNLRVGGRQDDGNPSSVDRGTSWHLHSCCDGWDVAITDDLNPVFWFTENGYVIRQPFSSAGQSVDAPAAVSGIFHERFGDRVYTVGGTSPSVLYGRAASGSGFWLNQGSGLPNGLGWSPSDEARAHGLRGSRVNGESLYAWGNNTLAVLQRSGGVWTPVRTRNYGPVRAVFASTEWPLEAWVGLQGGSGATKIRHTTDNWVTSTDITSNLGDVGAVNCIVVPPFQSSEIYVGTDIGVFRSLDGGGSWEPFQTGLPIVSCHSMRYVIDQAHAGNDRLVVGTYGRGMYERVLARRALVYVDPRNFGSTEDGSYEHAYKTLSGGLAGTPSGGMLALHAGTYAPPTQITAPMVIQAFESSVFLIP